jgi:SRSO17 transposase
MDAEQIRQLKPMLTGYLKRFDDCFGRKDTRAHFPVYVEGQLSELRRKSVEPIAKAANVPVRSLQEFLSLLNWNEDRMRDRLQGIVATEHANSHAVGIIDETSFAKQGQKTPGVQRQWCGHTGKTDNCIVTVHLAYAAGDFHCLLDGELFLPESWNEDRERCCQAKIPDDMVYRPKWKIALELLDRANSNGVTFAWLTFDEGYGGKPPFLRALRDRKQAFIGEVPCTFTGWLDPPRVTHRPFRHRRGRGRQTPRIVSGSVPAHEVAYLLEHDPRLRDQRWKRYRVKDGVQGPMVWEIKRAWLYGKDERELPERKPWLLVVARNVLHPEELKYFIGDAPRGTDITQFLLAAFSRWRVERCFEDQKDELGLDHYEGRRYPGLKRHLAISAVSYLFLSRVHQQLRGEKNRVDGLPSPHRGGRVAPVVVAHRSRLGRPDREYRKENPRDATR